MRLRDSPDELFVLVDLASRQSGIPQAQVEKDFWVVELLRSVSKSLGDGRVVFKGGTSLSKAYGLVERFSEDVDILVVPDEGLSKGAIDRILKAIVLRATEDLASQPELVAATTGVKRYVRYLYALAYPSGDVTEGVLLEMGIRGGPEPSSKCSFRSYVADYAMGRADVEGDYEEFAPVEIDVLAPARTLIEKLAHLHHLSVTYPKSAKWIPIQGRHFYDVYRLLGDKRVRADLAEDGFAARIAADREQRSADFDLQTSPRPEEGFAASPAFDAGHSSAEAWEASYSKALAFVYGDRPSLEECRARVRENAELL